MWFATQDGLNRYDGRNIDHFNFKPFDKQSISGDDIYSICLDSNMLFVLNDKGLDKINLSGLKISNLKRKSESEPRLVFSKSWILNNTLFLLSREGLSKAKFMDSNEFDLENCVFEDSSKKETRTIITSICSGDKESIFAATNKGIFKQNKGEKQFRKIFDLVSDKLFKKPTDNFYSSIAFNNGKLYFTNANTLICLNLSTLKENRLTLKDFTGVSCILIDKQDKIWIGNNGKGLLVVSQKACDSLCIEKHYSKTNTGRFAIQSNEITSLYQNPRSSDVVWIGTRDAGAFNFSYSKNSFSIPSSFVNTADANFFGIVKDKDGIIWAGYNAGILKINEAKKAQQIIDLSDFSPNNNRPVLAMCADEENNVWIAYGNNLYLIDKTKNTLITKVSALVPGKPNQSSKIVELNKTELLICTTRGIVVYNKQSNSVKLINSINVNGQKTVLENTESFLVDSKNNWWVGSSTGLYCIRQDDKNVILKHNNNDSNSILSNRIMDIEETNKGEIIVATTKGLSLIKNYGAQIKNIYAAKGLSNNFIYGLLEDKKGRFWMSTNFGISVFDPANFEFKSYTASDGICINEFNQGGFYKTKSGELIFGGLGGLVSVNPEYQIVNKSVADIILRSIKVEGYKDSISLNKTLILSYGQNDIYLEFSIPDYSGEKNMNLFYRFKNKDTAWIKVNPSQLFSLSFINLAPGNYNFEAVAVNNEGARSKPLVFSFKINDPFWSTWWFYLILVLITVFLSWVIYRRRLKRKISYIQQIEQIRKDENEKVRKAAALDLHDEFGNGLTRISMLIEMTKIQVLKENNEAHKLLELVSQNSNRLYHGTKDFIWSINPGKDNLYEIVIRIKDYADELFYGTQVTFEVEGLKEEFKHLKQLPTNGRNITMIFKESLSNAAKHAKATKVKFTIKQGSENIFLILEDDGIGFEMKDYKNSFGIENIHQRANRLAAEIEIAPTIGKGTKIVLVINLKKNENDSNSA